MGNVNFMGNVNVIDNVSLLIILRALFILDTLEKGWCVRKCKNNKNLFEIYKSIKNKNVYFL